MIFVFLDDGTLDVISDDLEAVQNAYEPQDVQSFKFYTAEGCELKPRIWIEEEKTSFLLVPIHHKIMRFELADTGLKCVGEILTKLDKLVRLNTNQWFSSIRELQEYFRKIDCITHSKLNIQEFIKTLYLGDRALKSYQVDGWNERAKFEITCISRVRGQTWNYYTAEDIESGLIVFEGVREIKFEPTGLVPNDDIHELRAEKIADAEEEYLIFFSVASIDVNANCTDVTIQFKAKSMYLEDPQNPEQKITC